MRISYILVVVGCSVIPALSAQAQTASSATPSQVATAPGATDLMAHPATRIDIDALSLKSDFSVFMQNDCPPQLRAQALKKLWSLSQNEPQLHNAF